MADRKFPRNTEIMEKLKKVIYEYSGQVSVAEVIGLLEMTKLELLEEQRGISDA